VRGEYFRSHFDNNQKVDNWIKWLQARIPELRKSHNKFWIKQALEAIKNK